MNFKTKTIFNISEQAIKNKLCVINLLDTINKVDKLKNILMNEEEQILFNGLNLTLFTKNIEMELLKKSREDEEYDLITAVQHFEKMPESDYIGDRVKSNLLNSLDKHYKNVE